MPRGASYGLPVAMAARDRVDRVYGFPTSQATIVMVLPCLHSVGLMIKAIKLIRYRESGHGHGAQAAARA
jgi:hypothetical protein